MTVHNLVSSMIVLAENMNRDEFREVNLVKHNNMYSIASTMSCMGHRVFVDERPCNGFWRVYAILVDGEEVWNHCSVTKNSSMKNDVPTSANHQIKRRRKA